MLFLYVISGCDKINNYLRGIIIVVTAVIVLVAYASRQRNERLEEYWRSIDHRYKYVLGDNKLNELDSIYPQLKHSTRFLFDYGMALRRNGLLERSNAVLKAGLSQSSDPMFLILLGRNYSDLGDYSQAEVFYQRAINRVPSRIYPRYLLAKLYALPEVGEYTRSIATIDSTLAMRVKVPSPATVQMCQELELIRTDLVDRCDSDR
jgi:tetratricopeptide (TPR) repeat protein